MSGLPKDELLTRLAQLEREVGDVGRLIEKEASFAEVLQMTAAISDTIRKFESTLIREHIRRSVSLVVEEDDPDEKRRRFLQVLNLIDKR